MSLTGPKDMAVLTQAVIERLGHYVYFLCYSVKHFITGETALAIEAATIDLIDSLEPDNLSNLQGGHYSREYGLKTMEEISAMYDAEKLSTKEPIILLNLNKRYKPAMTPAELYEASRQAWFVGGERRKKVKYAIPTYRGSTREVYEIEKWYPHEYERGRWAFKGKLADADIREELKDKNITSYIKKVAANPVRYLNC